MDCLRHRILALFVVGCITLTLSSVQTSARLTQPGASPAASSARAVFDKYCITCHNQRLHTAGLELDSLDTANPVAHAEVWEKVIAKLRAGSMPPSGRPRPDAATYHAVARSLEADIDRAWTANPNPGRPLLHRLNRTEYANAIRDLLALEVDATKFLPADDSSHGFDNMAGTLTMPPALVEAYLSAAGKISRLAIGDVTAHLARRR